MHLAPQNYLYPHEMKKKTFLLIRRGELNERGKDLKAYYHPPCEGGQGDVPLDGGNTSNGYSMRMLHPPTPFLRGIRLVLPLTHCHSDDRREEESEKRIIIPPSQGG